MVLGVNNMANMVTWVDAAYSVHEDTRSHMGGTMSFGTGVLMRKSTTHNLDKKSSTDLEVVGASDYLPGVI